jgi:toxin YhaV
LSSAQPLVINGWTIFAHPFFLDEVEKLMIQVERLQQKDSNNYRRKNATKRLAAIYKLAFETIPQDPTRTEYRQGTTLGDEYKHWFRAKFFQQYRLFFRYHLESKIIVLVWVNDEKSKRAYGSSTDAYRIFGKMIDSGEPPNNWDSLLLAAEDESNRLDAIVKSSSIESTEPKDLELDDIP